VVVLSFPLRLLCCVLCEKEALTNQLEHMCQSATEKQKKASRFWLRELNMRRKKQGEVHLLSTHQLHNSKTIGCSLLQMFSFCAGGGKNYLVNSEARRLGPTVN